MTELSAIATASRLACRRACFTDLNTPAVARRTATAAGPRAMGTLGILLEVKRIGLIPRVEPYVERLDAACMWLSAEIEKRVLALAGER